MTSTRRGLNLRVRSAKGQAKNASCSLQRQFFNLRITVCIKEKLIQECAGIRSSCSDPSESKRAENTRRPAFLPVAPAAEPPPAGALWPRPGPDDRRGRRRPGQEADEAGEAEPQVSRQGAEEGLEASRAARLLLRRVFKDCFLWHSDLRRHEGWFLCRLQP